MNDEKITRELAEQEFMSYCEANDIDCDESAMNEEDATAFKPIKESFIKACRAGRVVVDGKNIEYTISSFSPEGYAGNKLTIGRPNGNAMLAMDGYKDTQSMHKLQAYASAITGKETKYFSNLDNCDWMFVRNIATLFLSA
jgi:hypothetical protein